MEALVRSVMVDPDASRDRYPFTIPAIAAIDELALDPRATFLVGDNGTGKSTLIEAIAVAAGFNPEGGTANFTFATHESVSNLHTAIRLVRGTRRPKTGFFLRAESFFNVATEIDRLGLGDAYGGRSLHERSHGESFLTLALDRFGDAGLYVLDEPEAALSPQGCLALIRRMHELIATGAQFIIATHSPILMSYPHGTVYELDDHGIEAREPALTAGYQLTKDFLDAPDLFFRHLLA